MRTLHELPRFSDRWSYLYLDYGTLDQDASGLTFHNKTALTQIPIDQLSLLMLGPGTTVTHAAVKALASNSCLLAWTGADGIKLYAHSTGATFSGRRLLHQAWMVTDEGRRLHVARRMFAKRFPDAEREDKSLEQLRGMEGLRVRAQYETLAKEYGIEWQGRNYDQGNWFAATPVNRALSAAHACLYGVCHAAIVSAGYSAALGFIHTGKMLSFVYDIADLYKTTLTVPLAFRLANESPAHLERAARQACRQAFFEYRLMERILPDIAEVLDAGDVAGESADELEGRAVSLADSTAAGGVPGPSEPPGAGGIVGEGLQADQGGERDPNLDEPE